MTVDISTIIEVVTFILLLLGTAFGLWFRFSGAVDQERLWREAADKEEAAKRDELERAFHEHKLHVAQHHVTFSALQATEERLITAIEKLTARVETLVGRMEKVAIDAASAAAGKGGRSMG